MKITTKQIVLIALFVAIGIILPMAFHAAGTQLGRMFSPIHIPALVAGALMGGIPGLIVGALTVLLSSVLTSMPPFPYAFVMMAEVASYGLFAGIFFRILTKDILGIVVTTGLAMILGRIVHGVANYLILSKTPESIGAWITGAFVKGSPAIILHIILVPILVLILRKYVKDFD